MSRVDLSTSARADLLSIDLATIERFGFDQSLRLEAAFRSAFDALAINPHIGHERSDLSPPERVFRYWVVLKRFVVVYEPAVEGIRIARILDGSRDLLTALTEGDQDQPAKGH